MAKYLIPFNLTIGLIKAARHIAGMLCSCLYFAPRIDCKRRKGIASLQANKKGMHLSAIPFNISTGLN